MKNNLQAASVFLLIFLIAFFCTMHSRNDKRVDKELLTLTNNLIECRELLEELDTEQTELINQLTINFDKINMLQDELNELKISKDEFSQQSIMYMFDEVWDHFNLLEKRIK